MKVMTRTGNEDWKTVMNDENATRKRPRTGEPSPLRRDGDEDFTQYEPPTASTMRERLEQGELFTHSDVSALLFPIALYYDASRIEFHRYNHATAHNEAEKRREMRIEAAQPVFNRCLDLLSRLSCELVLLADTYGNGAKSLAFDLRKAVAKARSAEFRKDLAECIDFLKEVLEDKATEFARKCFIGEAKPETAGTTKGKGKRKSQKQKMEISLKDAAKMIDKVLKSNGSATGMSSKQLSNIEKGLPGAEKWKSLRYPGRLNRQMFDTWLKILPALLKDMKNEQNTRKEVHDSFRGNRDLKYIPAPKEKDVD